jgi:hypothetical protein
MKRWTILTALPLLLLAVFSFAQQFPAQPAPGQDERILGAQLIAWSEMQKPQPVPQQPQPIPAPDTKANQPSPAPDSKAEPKAQQRTEPEAQQSTAQSVSGTIIKVGGKFVLETADNMAYQLDDQDKAAQYEGKHVKITGTLDRTTGILHVKSVELMS